jgi:exportin-2 (importin alpha re-exporter)
VDVVKFFSDHVFQDLQVGQGVGHPILQVDAIRFLHTFRNQVHSSALTLFSPYSLGIHKLTKSQLLAVLPQLAQHLNSQSYVTYTYAAITIERILVVKQNSQLLFVVVLVPILLS